MPRYFKLRIGLSLVFACICSAIAGSAFVLYAQETHAPMTTYDAVQDGRIDNLADHAKTDEVDRQQLNKRMAEIERTEAELHGALWLLGGLAAFLGGLNTLLTFRSGIKRIEHEAMARVAKAAS